MAAECVVALRVVGDKTAIANVCAWHPLREAETGIAEANARRRAGLPKSATAGKRAVRHPGGLHQTAVARKMSGELVPTRRA